MQKGVVHNAQHIPMYVLKTMTTCMILSAFQAEGVHC